MIRAFFRSNEDELRGVEWPPYVAALPRKGDRVASKAGATKAIRYVCGVTHLHSGSDPSIEVDLCKYQHLAEQYK